ncbi:MAG: DUF333 domain-containing protein [Chloroflexi bacterium]|nr:DUF333 domain-containing protein [Chloroflexota bacterium]
MRQEKAAPAQFFHQPGGESQEDAEPCLSLLYQNGNKLEIRTAADGSQSGVCVFLDGSTCDERTYYR